MSARHILVVTGASGAGKTAAVQALEARAIDGLRCFYFDSIGVPSAEVMERDFGSGEKWQAHATAEWFSQLNAVADDVRVAVLDGQTRPSFVFDAATRAPTRAVHIVRWTVRRKRGRNDCADRLTPSSFPSSTRLT